MRSALAILLAVLTLVLAFAPHTHAGPQGDHACAACLARTADVARSAVPELAPAAAPGVDVPLAPVAAPPVGTPLGAVPGQSPPARA